MFLSGILFIQLLVLPVAASEQSNAPAKTDDSFLEMVQRRSFRYFLDCSNPANGLVLDRADNFRGPDLSYTFASISAVGFGLASLPVGVERGWISRAEASARTKTTLRFFSEKMESVHGFFYHFVDMQTGLRYRDVELSSIDTSLFLTGALTAAAYFGDPEITGLAEGLYRRVDWQWMMNGAETLCMGWRPEKGFISNHWDSYDENMVMYILALGSPTFPIPPASWKAIKRPRGSYKEHNFILSPPLFTHQFSHIFVDFRGKSDGFADYFENSVQATLANRRFCIDNAAEFKTYGPDSWGLSAGMGPNGYTAYGAPPGPYHHDGTVILAAPAASIVFTPELSLSALKYWYGKYRKELWGRYGFTDSFNLDRKFVATDAYGINQGPTLLMIENLRSGLVWRLFMSLPQVQNGMAAAGFGSAAGSAAAAPAAAGATAAPVDVRRLGLGEATW